MCVCVCVCVCAPSKPEGGERSCETGLLCLLIYVTTSSPPCLPLSVCFQIESSPLLRLGFLNPEDSKETASGPAFL